MGATNNQYVPTELLARLVGHRMYLVEFVLNDYVQFRFDGDQSPGHPMFKSYVWPSFSSMARPPLARAGPWLMPTPCSVGSRHGGFDYCTDGLRHLHRLATGAIAIHPAKEEIFVEVAELSAFADGRWMAWCPGEGSFEDLA